MKRVTWRKRQRYDVEERRILIELLKKRKREILLAYERNRERYPRAEDKYTEKERTLSRKNL